MQSDNKSMYESASAPPMPQPPPYSSVIQTNTEASYYPPEQPPAQLYSSPNAPVVVIYQQPSQGFETNRTPVRLVKSPDYLFWSIFNTFCCCCLFGLIAAVFSFKTRLTNRNPLTNYKSIVYSRAAYRLNVCATILGIIGILFGAIYEIIDLID